MEEVPRSSNQINLDSQLHPVVPSTIDSNLNNPSKISLMTSKLNLQTLKETLVVTSLLLVLSMKFVNKNITKLIPKLGNELGEINMMGLIVKALLGGIVFFIIKLFCNFVINYVFYIYNCINIKIVIDFKVN